LFDPDLTQTGVISRISKYGFLLLMFGISPISIIFPGAFRHREFISSYCYFTADGMK